MWPQNVSHEAETLIIGGTGNVTWYRKWDWFLKCRVCKMCIRLWSVNVCYIESAIVRIKWEKASYEHIENHKLMHYISEIEILPL